MSSCLHVFDLLFKREKAIISLCNCCFDLYLITNTAVQTLSPQTPTCLSSSVFLSLYLLLRAAIAQLLFGSGVYCPLLTFTYLPSLFPPPPPLVYRAPVSADLVLSQRLPARGFRRLPKSRKRRCVMIKDPLATSRHAHLFFFISYVPVPVCVSSPTCVSYIFKFVINLVINLSKQIFVWFFRTETNILFFINGYAFWQ